jgi:Na+/H+ antiporter NhaD/arsenite permease-like protein
MNMTTTLILINALLAVGLQGVFRNLRHIIIAAGAIVAIIITTMNGVSLSEFFKLLPLDVLAILLSLQLFGDIVIDSRIFDILTRFLAKTSKGKGWLIIFAFGTITYLVSCFMDNYQCLLLLIPPILGTLKQVRVSKRFLQIVFGLLIITSNLGGASTPVGDFPALFMLSKGIIDFKSYLLNVTPLLLIAITLCTLVALAFYHFNKLDLTEEEEKTSVAFTQYLYRNVRIDWKILAPAIIIFVGMAICWIKGFDATKVSIIGFLILALCVKLGKTAEEKIKKTEAGIFIYYLCLFVIVVSIQQTGLLTQLGDYLLTYKDNKLLMILLFVTATTLVTGAVSAGPATVAMFPVVQALKPLFPDSMVLTCFVLSICAGSSLLMTSATAGPLMASLTEQYDVVADGKKYSYNFREYLLPGFIGALMIYLVNVAYIFVKLS